MPGPLTVTFKSVLHGVHTRNGGDPDSLQNSVAAAITEYINSAYKFAWRFYAWPDAVLVETRTSDADKLIDRQQAGEEIIETLLGIYKGDPRTSVNPRPLPFRSWRSGFYVPSASTEYFIAFRPPAPSFTHIEYDAATAYASGDICYHATTGEVYKATASTTGNLPTDTDYWTKVDFLDIFAETVKAAAHAAMLRDERQIGAAAVIEAAMRDALISEMERIERQELQFRRINVINNY